jgi:hypothetical protein
MLQRPLSRKLQVSSEPTTPPTEVGVKVGLDLFRFVRRRIRQDGQSAPKAALSAGPKSGRNCRWSRQVDLLSLTTFFGARQGAAFTGKGASDFLCLHNAQRIRGWR